MADFTLTLANGKVGEFDDPSELYKWYANNSKPPKKKRKRTKKKKKE